MTSEIAQKCSEGNNKTSEQKKKYRNFCFTAWDGEIEFDEKRMRWLCRAPETCPESGKFHWQGAVTMKNQMTFSAICKYLKKQFGCEKDVNVEVCKGSPEDNRTYCGGARYEKDGKVKEANPDFKEWGNLPKQGARGDIDDLKDAIMAGKITVDEITLENPEMTHKYGRTLDRVEAIALRKKFRTWMTKGEWYYGETGSGKSHIAYEGFSPETHYVVSLGQLARGFWTGYTGQEVVIINEFRGQISFGELMDLVDKWPKSVDVKCKEPVPFLAKRFIVTGPKNPAETYCGMVDKGDSIDQLYRRFKVYQCLQDGDKHIQILQDHGFNEATCRSAGPTAAPPQAGPPAVGRGPLVAKVPLTLGPPDLETRKESTLRSDASVLPDGLESPSGQPELADGLRPVGVKEGTSLVLDDGTPVRKENPFAVKLTVNGGKKLWGQTKLFGCQGIKE